MRMSHRLKLSDRFHQQRRFQRITMAASLFPAVSHRNEMTKLLAIACFLFIACMTEAYAPKPITRSSVKPALPSKTATAAGGFAAFFIATSVLSNPLPAQAVMPMGSSTTMIAEKQIREGIYGEYEVDVQPQQYDDARSTFKPAKETKSKKGKYTAILAILIVGSFIIPMAQYFWYVKDDDSSEKFFAGDVPEPDAPKKKKWF